ncbi:non-ribosomal peptide synthetase [Ahniella affigens]|uniref:non-ribosomal peptide synthetase n=1 Tax=Ahniella affigens TaxID=2021234 RepID=UPI0011B1F355|nr:non-ribosomal peptide synthetase [Ahniella affigens]
MNNLNAGAVGAEVSELIAVLAQKGIRIGLRDDGLDIAAPKGAMTGELKERLVRNKAGLVQWLRAHAVQKLPKRPDLRARIVQHDLRAHVDPEAAMQALVDADAVAAFDLEQGPPLRVSTVQMDDEHFVLMINLHHLFGDGQSMSVLASDLGALYEAERQHAAPNLPDLPIQYGDYAVWQRSRLDAEALDRLKRYWLERLRGAPPSHGIPIDYARPSVPSHRGDGATLQVSATTAVSLRSISRGLGATLFSTLFAAFALAQHRFGGATDLVAGTVAANRERVELEGLIGFFVNTVVLRAQVDLQKSFKEFLRGVSSDVRDGFANQDLPFDQLVELLKPPRDPSRHPIFQLMFTVVQSTTEPAATDGAESLNMEPVGSEISAKFDLALAVHDRPDGLHCALNYARDLFSAETADALLETYRSVLDAVAKSPDVPMASLFETSTEAPATLVPADAVTLTAQEWFERHGVGDVLDYSAQGVHRQFEREVLRSGEVPAVVFGSEVLTYAALNARANQLAHHLRSLGVGPECLVGLYLPRSIDQIVGVMAIWKAGGAYVPMDVSHPTGRLESMLADASPLVILTHEGLVSRLPETSAVVLRMEQSATYAGYSAENLSDDGSGSRLAYVLYTSGSTGKPKGVEIEHGSLSSLAAAWVHQRGEQKVGRHVAINAPMVFDVSVQQLLQLLSGATLYPVPEQTRLDIDALWRFMEASRLDEFDCTPSLMQVLLDTLTEARRGWLPKMLLVGGEAISERQWRQLLGLRGYGIEACNGYGPTECTVYTTYGPVVPESAQPVIGRPVPNLRLYVLDDHGEVCGPGVAGELYVAGAGVARGYRSRPDLTAERFVERMVLGRLERLYRTGDWVRWKEDGTLEYFGRRDGQVKLRGFRIELGEIAAVLESQSGVRQAVVVVAGEGPSAQLVAYVVGEADTDGLRDALAERLPAYMVPTAWMSLPALPLNTNGKIDVRALPAPVLTAREYVAPTDALEQTIVSVFEELLGQSPISVHDHFFALGGHSLLAMRAAARINQLLGVDLPAYRVFDLATVAELAPVVRDLQRAGKAVLIPRYTGDRRRMPLSPGQYRQWLFNQVDSVRRGVFNIPEQRSIRGEFEHSRLQRAFTALLARHESLRTRIVVEGDEPWQCVESGIEFDLPLLDLSNVPDANARLEALAIEDAQEVFDLEQAPLLRAKLVRMAPDRHIILLNIHHIVSDGLSQEVLWRELAALYANESLPALPFQFGDYAAWEQSQSARPANVHSEAYWTQHLADLPVCHSLPLRATRPTQQGIHALTARHRLPDGVTAALKQLGQQERTTSYITLLAAFHVLQAQFSGVPDSIVGTPVSTRQSAESEGLIGLFTDILVMRQNVSLAVTFRELLQQVRSRVLEAYEHQDMNFEQVVRVLSPPRTSSHHPLFQILFSVEQEPATVGAWQPIPVIAEQPPQFDLSMVIREGEALTCNLTYNTDLFDASGMNRMLGYYERLLTAVSANPDLALNRLDLLSDAERAWLLAQGTGPVLPVSELGVHRQFEREVLRSADVPAVVFGSEVLTYAALNARANQLAHHLRSLGVGPECLVGLYLPRSIDQIVGVMAIWKAGGAYVPMDVSHPTGRLESMLADASPLVILTHEGLVSRLPETSAVVLRMEQSATYAGYSAENLSDDGSGSRLAYVLYTSGSTGKPKGVEIEHGSLSSLAAAWVHQRGEQKVGRHVAINAPMVFDVSVQQLLQLLSGATLYPVPEQTRLDIDALWRFMEASRLDEFDCTPSLMQVLLDTLTEARRGWLPKMLLVGGEAISERQWRQLLGLRGYGIEACNGYGPTECTVYTTYGPVVPESAQPVIGRPVPNLRLYVLDDHGEVCGPGVAGELYVAGAGVARGYRSRPDLTAERFVERMVLGRLERLYRTGDWVRWKEDGTLEYFGRRDGQVKLRGFRIELGEIAAVLESQSGVRQAVVVVAGEGPSAQLVAYVVGEADTDGLRDALAERLPAYMVPTAWMSLPALPLNTNGKIDVRALPAPELTAREYVAPTDALEQTIVSVFEELLGQSPISVHDHFFALGGHSLLAMRAAARINQLLGVDLPAYRVFDLATVAELAPVVRDLQRAGKAVLIPRYTGDRRRMPLSMAQQRLWLVEKMSAAGSRSLYNIPVHLRIRGELDLAVLERAFQALVTRHETLRTRLIEIDGEPWQCVEPAEGRLVAPVSYAQRQLWLINELEGRDASGLYNIPLSWNLDGPVDPSQLESAFGDLLARHEVLRTHFVEIDGEPWQFIAPEEPFKLVCRDLRDQVDPVAAASALAAADLQQGFDLRRGPLLRAQLLRLAEDRHMLLVCLHHIAADGWSMGILARELNELYRARVEQRTPVLPVLPVQYGDYAHWQRNQVQNLESQLQWWQQQLTNLPACHSLPTDRPRPSRPSHRGATLSHDMPATVASALQALSTEERATAYMTLLAGFQLLLARLSGASDIVVGTAVTNRPFAELEGLIGFFVNTLVLRQSVDTSLSFRDLLKQVRERVLAAYQRQDAPFEQVVQAVRPERSASYHPLVQLMFSVERLLPDAESAANQVAPSNAEVTDDVSNWAKFDLSLLVREGETLSCSITYATDLFDRASMVRLLSEYERLLTAVSTDPDRPLNQLDLLQASERAELLETGAGDVVAVPSGTVHAAFEARVNLHPERIAVQMDGRGISYAELNATANRLARRLLAAGIQRESIVGIFCPRSIEQVVAILAILKAGAAYLPLELSYPKTRLADLTREAGAALVLTFDGLQDKLPDTLPTITLDAPNDWQQFDESNLALECAGSLLAYVIYTSGSTGTPKGVEIEHRQLLNLWSSLRRPIADALGSRDWRTSMNAPLVFDSSVKQWLQVLDGATLCPVPEAARHDAGQLWQFIETERITVLDLTPSLLQTLLDVATERQLALLPRVLLIGGEAISARLWQTLLELSGRYGVQAFNVYGPTECTVDTTMAAIQSACPQPVIGRPLNNVRLYVLDHDGNPCAVGMAGELYVAGAGVARGYRSRPDLTAERFVERMVLGRLERLYRTGDWVRWKEDGTLEYFGRRDGQVKLRGFRIELGEIAAVLESQSGVRQAVVVVAGEGPSAQLVAYVVGEADTDGLRDALAERLPAYMVPTAWMSLPALPLNTNGKIDVRALPAPELTAREYVAPTDALEQTIVSVFEELLGQSPISVHDHFFALGGHSLLAMRAAARINQLLGVDLPAYRVFDLATVAELAPVVRDLQRAGKAVLILRYTGDRRRMPLSMAQQRLWLVEKMHGDAIAGLYNIPFRTRLQGPLSVPALESAVSNLVARHESLRTRFVEAADQVWQCVEPAATVQIEQRDLRSESDPIAALHDVSQAWAAQAFDLAAGPLFRIQLVCLGADQHALLMCLHHIIADGWSMGVLAEELTELYDAALNQREPNVRPLPIQYGDFAHWQRTQEHDFDAQLQWWRQELSDLPTCHSLPTARPRPAQLGYRGATLSHDLSASVARSVQALAHEERATAFMTLLAAFQVLLAQQSGASDIVVGTPTANRPNPELQGLIGFFVNTLVLRQQVDDTLSFRGLLRQVRERVLAAYQRQDVPFEQIVQAINPERSAAHHPLFQILFSTERVAGLANANREADGGAAADESSDWAKFDLSWVVREGDTLSCSLTYNTDLFDAAGMNRMLGYYERLLTAVSANPDLALNRLDLLSDAERAWLLAQGTGPVLPVSELGVHRQFEREVLRSADVPAVVFGSEVLTYAALNARANQLAHHLRSLGVGPECLVGLYLPRSIDQIVGVMAIWKAGGAYVPMDVSHPTGRLESMLADASPLVILTHEGLVSRLPETSAVVLRMEQSATYAGYSAENLSDDGSGSRLAYVLYTSGSTGKPKGVEIEHGSLSSLAAAWVHQRGEQKVGRHVAINAPMVFDVSVQQLLQLLSGATLYPVPEQTRLDIDALWRFMEASRLDEFDCTPSLMQVLLDTLTEARRGWLPKMLLVGGEAISERQWRQLLGLRGYGIEACNGYGPTECTVYTTYGPVVPESAQPVIGRPVPNLRLYVLDDHGEVCGPGVAGELYVAGAGVARGYRSRPDLTAERFVERMVLGRLERLYRTGDWVRWKEDGTLEYFGRRDGQVKLRGFRIELGEIAAVLESQYGVRQAVVVVAGEGPSAQLVAYVVGEADTDGLRDALAERLPAYMVPTAWMSLPALPLNTNGKIDVRALPKPLLRSGAMAPPRNHLEHVLQDIWQSVLGVAPIGIHDRFFALGGHSLLAVRMLAAVRQALGRTVTVAQILGHDTIAELAGLLGRESIAAAAPIVTLRHGRDDQPSVLFLPPVGGSSVTYHRLLSAFSPTQTLLAGHLDVHETMPTLDGTIRAAASRYLDYLIAGSFPLPHCLVGWSMGGVLAHEIAALMINRSMPAPTIVLIDSHVPIEQTASGPSERGAAHTLAAELGLTDQAFDWDADQGIHGLHARLTAAGLIPDELDVAQLQRRLTLIHHHMRILAQHQPTPAAVPVLLFKALNSRDARHDNGWTPFVASIRIQAVTTDHFAIMRTPNVERLAREMAGVLVAAAASADQSDLTEISAHAD